MSELCPLLRALWKAELKSDEMGHLAEVSLVAKFSKSCMAPFICIHKDKTIKELFKAYFLAKRVAESKNLENSQSVYVKETKQGVTEKSKLLQKS
jgi:hypothetical protein